MRNTLENLTTDAFARAASVTVETIRFYQRKGYCRNRSARLAVSTATDRRTWRGGGS